MIGELDPEVHQAFAPAKPYRLLLLLLLLDYCTSCNAKAASGGSVQAVADAAAVGEQQKRIMLGWSSFGSSLQAGGFSRQALSCTW